MSGTTSVPFPVWTSAGFVVPDTSAILTGVQADINAAFGGQLTWFDANGDPLLETPEGQIATTLTAIIDAVFSMFLSYINGVDPAFSSGRMQDAIARIYFISREAASSTTTQVTLNGLPGKPVPTGFLLQASDGNLYSCLNGGAIGANSYVTLTFACTATGPIACPAQTFAFYQAIGGIDTAISAADGIVGSLVETPAAFEARRSATVANNSLNSEQSVRAAILDQVAGVDDCFTYDNDTGATVTVSGVPVPAHSLYVCVAGGSTAAIAQAIFTKKPPGCGLYGATNVTVYDPNYETPRPYTMTFDVAGQLETYFAVTLANTPNLPSNAAMLVQGAIIAAFGGADGGPKVRIGQTLFASRFYAPIMAALGPNVQIVSIYVGTASNPTLFEQAVQANQIPVTSKTNIAVTAV